MGLKFRGLLRHLQTTGGVVLGALPGQRMHHTKSLLKSILYHCIAINLQRENKVKTRVPDSAAPASRRRIKVIPGFTGMPGSA